MYIKIKRFLRSVLISPIVFLVTLYILLEDFLNIVVKPFVDYISSFHILQIAERFLQKRNPYTLLAIYICKLSIFSSIKFLALYLISQGFVYGVPLIICSELTGAMITVWYAKVAFPILLTIKQFAWAYNKFSVIKTKWVNNIKQMKFYQYAKAITQKIKTRYLRIKEMIKNRNKSNSFIKAVYRFKHSK